MHGVVVGVLVKSLRAAFVHCHHPGDVSFTHFFSQANGPVANIRVSWHNGWLAIFLPCFATIVHYAIVIVIIPKMRNKTVTVGMEIVCLCKDILYFVLFPFIREGDKRKSYILFL